MAFLASGGSSGGGITMSSGNPQEGTSAPSSSSSAANNPPLSQPQTAHHHPTLVDLQRSSSQAELLTQQLLASMQHHNAAVASAAAQQHQQQHSDAVTSSAHLYNQLLAHHQMQNSQQPPSLPISPPVGQNVQQQAPAAAAAQQPANDLIQQLASTLLVNPSLAALHPQLASLAQQAQQQQQAATAAQNSSFGSPPATANPNLAALSSMLNGSMVPSMLGSTNGQSPAASGANGIVNPNPLASLTSQLLLAANAGQAQGAPVNSQQQQLLQRLMAGANGANANPQPPQQQNNMLSLIQMLQTTNPMLASQLLANHQMQQQQANPNLALLNQLIGNVAGANRGVTDINQLVALFQQTQVPSQGVPSQGEQTPKTPYDEYLLRQQQQHQIDSQQAFASAVSAAAHQLPGRLSTQNSSNSLLAGISGGGGGGFESPISTSSQHAFGSVVSAAAPIATSAHTSAAVGSAANESNMTAGSANNSGSSTTATTTAGNTPNMQSTSRQASSDRLLSMNSTESVQDHISRLISENEAIVEPNPVLLKRRPYHRQSTSNSITSQTSEMAGPSQRGSPSLFHQVPNNRLPTTRSQSMHESQMSLHCGSLTSGQPILRPSYGQQPPQQQATQNNLACTFCATKFPNEAGLKIHENRCNKRGDLTKRLLLQKHQSQPQLQWNAAQQINQHQRQFLLEQQQKILAQQKQHQSNIAALVGGGAGVAPDPLDSVTTSASGRSSVPIGSGTSGASTTRHQQLANNASPPTQAGGGSPSASSTGSTENRHPLKKRLLESVAKNSDPGAAANSSTSSPTSVTPSIASSSMPNIDMHEAQNSPAKIAKLVQDHVKTAYEICLF